MLDYRSVLEHALEAAEEARDSRAYQAECAAKAPWGEEEAESAESAAEGFTELKGQLKELARSWVVLTFTGGDLDPRCVEAATAEEAQAKALEENGGSPDEVHGIYPGFIGMNTLMGEG